MQRLTNEKMIHQERVSNLLLIVLLFLVGILAIVRVLISNQTVGVSEKLHTLDDQISAIDAQNAVLSENLRKSQSLLILENKAREAGFVNSSNFAALTKEPPVAFQINLFDL